MAVQLPNFLGAQLINPDYSGLADIFQNYYGGKALKQQDIIGQNQAKAAPLDLLIKQNQAKSAPLDLLMKQIQAEFARPNAETALAGAKLGNQSVQLTNRQAQMTMQKLQQELGNEARFNAAMKAAQAAQRSGQGGGMGMGGGQGGMMPQGINPNMMPQGNQPSIGNEAPSGAAGVRQQINGTALQKGLMDIMQDPMMRNQPMLTGAPLLKDHPGDDRVSQDMGSQSSLNNQPKPKTQELNAGNPAEYFVDKMWDDEPGMRPFLIKKGYKEKEVKEVYDKSTGATRVTTTWPSKRKTVTIIPPMIDKESMEGDIPLTKPVLNDAVKQIRGTDAVMPYLDKLIEKATPTKDIEKERAAYIKSKGDSLSPNDEKLKNYDEILAERKTNYGWAGKASGGNDMPTFYWQPGNAHASYKRLLQESKDKYLKATGLNNTDATLHTMEEIMARGFGESDPKYLRELKALKASKIKEREENIRMVSKGLKRYSDFEQTPSGQSYSSNEWEVTDER